jgi:hypothetical protein
MPASPAPAPAAPRAKAEPRTLFQKYFKSVGPRTYAAQVKEAGNGNHFIVLTEGKRDEKTDELKKHSIYIFSEDFDAFRDLLRDTFAFVRDHPVSAEVKAKRQKFWNRQRQRTQTGQSDKSSGRQGE